MATLPSKRFASITLPHEIVSRVKRLVKSRVGHRYRSVSEFINEAVEEKLTSIGEAEIVSIKEAPWRRR
ncbi:MAG: hypothetical protein ACE5PO_05295 [Candidatus Bathyarchaeia archaeon]